jgi:hypothetical protein
MPSMSRLLNSNHALSDSVYRESFTHLTLQERVSYTSMTGDSPERFEAEAPSLRSDSCPTGRAGRSRPGVEQLLFPSTGRDFGPFFTPENNLHDSANRAEVSVGTGRQSTGPSRRDRRSERASLPPFSGRLLRSPSGDRVEVTAT